MKSKIFCAILIIIALQTKAQPTYPVHFYLYNTASNQYEIDTIKEWMRCIIQEQDSIIKQQKKQIDQLNYKLSNWYILRTDSTIKINKNLYHKYLSK